MTPEEIEASIELPEGVLDAVLTEMTRQDVDRGEWVSPRTAQQPDPPWPATSSPIFAYLLQKAAASIAAGMPVRDACIPGSKVELRTTTEVRSTVAVSDEDQRSCRWSLR
jgi:hypothetical protein